MLWSVFLVFTILFYLRPFWFKRISYTRLIIVAFLLQVFFGAGITWGQYYVWSHNEFTKTLLLLPLPNEVSLPSVLTWAQHYFYQPFGYFLYYSLWHFWLSIVLVCVSALIFYLFLKVWQFYRGGFLPNGPEIIVLLMLLVGWPGTLVLIPLGFVFSLATALFHYWKGQGHIYIETSFIMAAPIALWFSHIIFYYL